MRLSITKVTALIGTTTSAISALMPPTLELRSDGRAATLFKHPDLREVNNDSTFVPTSPYCTDISNIFGGFDGRVKSLSVEKGFKCDFYTNTGCSINDFAAEGAVLEVGSRDVKEVRKRLGRWEGKIVSLFCHHL